MQVNGTQRTKISKKLGYQLSQAGKFLSLMALSAGFSGWLHAANPTPAQIAQFQSLPKAQQEALAKQYGFDLSSLQQGQTTQTQSQTGPTINEREVNAKPERDMDLKGFDTTQELELFGYSLFAGEPTSMAPSQSDMPAPSNYIMGPGDELLVQVYGKDNEAHSFKVGRDGTIDFPKLGPVNVAGQSFDQVKKTITEFVQRKVIGVDVTVSLGNIRTMQVFVLGDAYKPGTYVLSSLSTVTQAIRAAGGIDTLGSLRNIQVKRDGKIIRHVDLYDLLLNGDTSADIRLRDGDSIYIAPRGATVVVDGEVRRRAIYELKKTAPLGNVIRAAGGLSERAYSQKIIVARATKSGTDIFHLDYTKSKDRNFTIRAGDRIKVAEVTKQFNNAIALLGSVVRPGAYPWRQGIRLSHLVGDVSRDLTKEADLNYGLIVREKSLNGDVEILQFNLSKALKAKGSVDDPVLQKRDQVVIFNKDLGFSLEELSQQSKTTTAQLENIRSKSAQQKVNFQQTKQEEQRERQQRLEQAKNAEIGQISDEELNIQDQASLKLSEVDSSNELTRSAQQVRERLLQPIVAQLLAQSSPASPVKIVEIRGAVKFPGVYPLAKGQTFADLIAAAGGLKESADLMRGEMTRMVEQGGKANLVHRDLNLKHLLNGDVSSALYLASKDRINIFTRAEWREDLSIEVGGEVMFPGRYTFSRGDTINDIIQRAGGLTEFAYPQGAVFSRETLRQQEAQKLTYLHEQLRQEVSTLAFRRKSSSNPLSSSSSAGDAMMIVDQLGVAEPVGRMVINLDQIIEGNQQQNVMLENGDKIYVPPKRNVITVMGHVQMPSSQIYDSSMSVKDYLDATGGPKKQADTDRIYVIRANGSVMMPNNSYWFKRGEEPLQPGDTIVVPMDTNYLDALDAWTSGTQILYQLGVAWSAIKD
ncbi:SLBB domain-containing protein [Motilimonas eburnea]|uniref:SLBB domain-containing protein n=1 Tax=Motilimonas eburnea TaxID=1737488 RepID=UPI001E478F78|nr:SLBB domain-containing protein [Motilimonas eburnea]MCE2572602.1 SLBB domain-containing protein [Motilimonas eburnea]